MKNSTNIYPECTDCNKMLTDEEIQKNKEHENFYYPICDECLHRATERVIKIMLVDGKKTEQ